MSSAPINGPTKTVVVKKKDASVPANIQDREEGIDKKARKIEEQLPSFLKGYFVFLNTSVLVHTRLCYLKDLKDFCEYMIQHSKESEEQGILKEVLTKASEVKDIALDDFEKVRARHVNNYIGVYCAKYYRMKGDVAQEYTTSMKTKARKRSSLVAFFGYLNREELVEKNIIAGFNPIKIGSMSDKVIKALDVDEVDAMIELIKTGSGLSKKQLESWERTKKRDLAIILLFLTYGLRLFELQNLNLSSINFKKKNFVVYRKRSKVSEFALNNSTEKVLKEYIEQERVFIKANKEDADALFLSITGTRMSEEALRVLVKKYTSMIMGVSKESGYSPHKLRATTATTLIEKGKSIFDVQQLLDHNNVTTTQLYAKHKENSNKELISNFELLDVEK